MAIKDHVNRVAKMRISITAVDPAQRLIHAVGADGGAKQVSVFDVPAYFVWPRVGEQWTAYEENGYWYLGNKFLNPNENIAFQSMNPGDRFASDDVVNAKYDFGAVGDSKTDNTQRIQDALDYAKESGKRAVYVPHGNYRIGNIVIPEFVTLFGAGPGPTIFEAIEDIADDSWMITQSTPSMVTAHSFQVDGLYHGTNVGGLNFIGDWCYLHTIMVTRVSGTGVFSHNYSGNNIVGVQVWDVGGHGFYFGPDGTVTNCQAGVVGKDAFYLEGNTQLTNCKGWYAGYYNGDLQTDNIAAGFGHGFHWKPGATFQQSANLNAQDNAAAGFKLHGCFNVSISGFVADSNNNRPGGTNSNIEITNNAGSNSLTGGQSVDRGANAPNHPNSGIAIAGGCMDNYVEIKTGGLGDNKIDTYTTGNLYRNELVVDGSRGQSQGIPYAASITVDPTLGNLIDVGPLTGNIAVTLPKYTTSDPITLLFQQDATGGRTITWNGNILTSWQPDATANARSSITIRYDTDIARWKPVAYFKGTP